METSSYSNPYGSAQPTPSYGMNQPATPSTTMTQPPKARTNWLVSIIFLLIGMIVGAAAGYFGSDYFVFGPKLDTAESEKAQLESRLTALENEIAELKKGQTTTPGTTTPGTGTAPTVSGITPDAQTADWSTFTSTEFNLSFKYPSDMTVRTFQNSGDLAQLEDDDVIFAAGIYKTGDPTPAGIVYIYKTEENDGPTRREILLNKFADKLPTSVVQESAGAGLINAISEKSVVLNGTQAAELGAIEGRSTTPTPGGKSYKAYLLEDQFSRNYLAMGCSTDTTSQAAVVACLMQTTVSIVR